MDRRIKNKATNKLDDLIVATAEDKQVAAPLFSLFVELD